MDIIEKIRNMVLRFLRIDHLSEDPTDDRLTFINNPKDVIKQDISEARVWFVGDSNELLNYYTQKQAVGNYNEPIYNRNRVNYFWGLSSQEANIKRVHSGLATAIVDTLVNITDFPQITAMANGKELDLEGIFRETQFKSVIMQSQMPWMLAEGYGALKFDIDRSVSKMPIVEYYEGKDVEFISKRGRVIGVIFKDYYKYKGNDYVLLDTRRLDETGSSCVEYELFKLSPNGDVDQCELDEVPELGKLKDLKIPGYGKLLAVPCKFLSHPNDKSYGKPLLYGRYDLLDDLDQSLSQRSVTSRESTPVEYIPSDLLERNKEGQPILPKRYNRTYVAKDGIPNGDGAMDGQIQTTQPNLNFDQYTQEQKAIVDQILIGILSPASMGIDIAKKDNGEAQREKEKATLMTRNNIINCETQILTQAVNIILALTAYMESGNLPLADFDVSVKYGEFANPSFENISQTLLPLWQAGAISDEMYVDKLYGDSLSEAEKQKELEALKAKRSEDTLKMGISMKAEWEAIWRNKQTLLDKARQANENYVLAIYEGISKGKDLRSLIRQVRSIKSLNLKMGLPNAPDTERYAISIAKRIKKATPQAVLGLKSHEALGIYCLKQLQRLEALKGLSKLSYLQANKQEAQEKQGLLNKLVDNEDPVAPKGAKTDEPLSLQARIFYLCSWHGDCAQDHEEWQGKLYYDRFWRRHVKDKETQERVLDFIETNGMMSLQWVTNNPVWLITRPNCRHYFEQVTIKEALGKSTDELLDERDMKRQYGERGTNQTIRHSTQEGWYTRENVLNIIQKYKERLALHQRMYEIQPSETLKGYIEKDKRLIKKWRYMLGKI